MPFVKLDCKILDSTLWLDIDASRMFITALLMAAPWDTEVEMEQLDVNTMEPTGWKLPPGWYGFVPAAGPGIVRRAGLDIKPGMAALVRLGAPEPESRSPSYEGRRLVRVNGGFVVLNYMLYREKDHNAAERMRNHRLLAKSGWAEGIKAQGGRCDCCGDRFELPYAKYVVRDHDHKTSKNRGLVCQSCNKVIGLIERGLRTYSDKNGVCQRYIDRYAVTAHVTGVHPNVTQAEAEAEAEGGVYPPLPPHDDIQKANIVVIGADSALDDGTVVPEKSNGAGRRKQPPCPHEAIIELYHEILPMCPKVRIWTDKRKHMLITRWREDPERQSLAWWRGYFKDIAESRFLTGRSKENFTVTLEWLIKPSNLVKVYEGTYHHDR
jgi:Recombination endonuclease VII